MDKNNSNNIHYFITPVDKSIECFDVYNLNPQKDLFYAISHGVNRAKLKTGKIDSRLNFLQTLIKKLNGIKLDFYGINGREPIWGNDFYRALLNVKMGLNLSRGDAIKYYSSDRITQIIGNGLVTLIDEKTCYGDFFDDTEMVFYKNITDLSEKIEKISENEKLRKAIGKKGKAKYMKYFNSTLVADFIINKTYEINGTKKYLWHKP